MHVIPVYDSLSNGSALKDTPLDSYYILHLLTVLPPAAAEIQAFDGLAPEVINSRLAMLGFAVAAFFELTQGLDVFQQIKTYPLLTIATFVIFTTASWIPLANLSN